MAKMVKSVTMMKPCTSSSSAAIHQAQRSIKHSDLTRHGFTMIEVVVMLAIITMISTVVLISFTGLREGGAVNRAARELALGIRRAQNMSLAVTLVETSAGLKTPPAVGVKLERANPSIYFLFADLLPDNKFTPEDAKIGQDENFPPGIRINSLLGPSGTSHSLIYIMFAAPEATVTIADANGASIGEKVEVELGPSSGQKRTVTTRTSGQVSIK